MPSKRDYRAAYERRNERARNLGYQSYYDYRAHDNGRIPPASARLRGARLARARGHRSAADLRREIKPGELVLVDGTRRRSDGRYSAIDLRVIGADGTERDYTVTRGQISTAKMAALVDRIEAKGGTLSPVSSQDLRTVIRDIE